MVLTSRVVLPRFLYSSTTHKLHNSHCKQQLLLWHFTPVKWNVLYFPGIKKGMIYTPCLPLQSYHLISPHQNVHISNICLIPSPWVWTGWSHLLQRSKIQKKRLAYKWLCLRSWWHSPLPSYLLCWSRPSCWEMLCEEAYTARNGGTEASVQPPSMGVSWEADPSWSSPEMTAVLWVTLSQRWPSGVQNWDNKCVLF